MNDRRPSRSRVPAAVLLAVGVVALVAAGVVTLALVPGPSPADSSSPDTPSADAVGTDVWTAQAGTEAGEAPVGTAPAGRLPPRPAVVDVDADPPDGEVVFRHGVAWMALSPGSDGQPELHLVNGADRRLELTLEALPVRADELGAPMAHDPEDDETVPSPLPSADGWVTLAEHRVVLDPDERATLRPTVTVPDDATPGPHLAALRARAATGERTPVEITALLVVEVPGPDAATAPAPADPRLDVTLEQRGATAAIGLRVAGGETVSAVSGRLEVHGWWGGEVASVELPPVVVLPRTERVRELDVRPPIAPGRYTVTAVLETRDGERLEASGSGWLWHRDAAVAVALVLLVVAILALLRTHRREGTGSPVATDGASQDP